MIKLRQFRSADLNALYAISLATGHEGGDASHLYEDAKLMGHKVVTHVSGTTCHPCLRAGHQKLGIKEVDDGIWLVSFMHYDLGYFDLEQKTLQPLDNPFGTRLSPMS
jgi:hypothetical protein